MSKENNSEQKIAIRLEKKDNVVTLTDKAEKEDEVMILSKEGEEIKQIKVTSDVPVPYHKIAVVDLEKGDEIIKYNVVNGYATEPIEKGTWVHTHNVVSAHIPENEEVV